MPARHRQLDARLLDELAVEKHRRFEIQLQLVEPVAGHGIGRADVAVVGEAALGYDAAPEVRGEQLALQVKERLRVDAVPVEADPGVEVLDGEAGLDLRGGPM